MNSFVLRYLDRRRQLPLPGPVPAPGDNQPFHRSGDAVKQIPVYIVLVAEDEVWFSNLSLATQNANYVFTHLGDTKRPLTALVLKTHDYATGKNPYAPRCRAARTSSYFLD